MNRLAGVALVLALAACHGEPEAEHPILGATATPSDAGASPSADATASTSTAPDTPPTGTADASPTTPPPTLDASTAPTDAGASDAKARALNSCPATYESRPAPSCGPDDHPGPCTYPEGTCSCSSPPYCGGAAPPPPPPPSWMCAPTKAPCAKPGTPCSKPHETCWIGPCHYGAAVTCANGTWTAVMGAAPP